MIVDGFAAVAATHGPEMTEHANLDVEQLDELRRVLGAPTLAGLLEKFRGSVSGARTDIALMQQRGDAADMRRAAHRTAGLCLQLAAPRAGGLAARLEARPDDAAAAADLCVALDDLQAALAAYLERMPSE